MSNQINVESNKSRIESNQMNVESNRIGALFEFEKIESNRMRPLFVIEKIESNRIECRMSNIRENVYLSRLQVELLEPMMSWSARITEKVCIIRM
jgi:hypothetical protein